MVGHLGFSYVGLIYLLMLWIPIIIWSRNKPIDYDTTIENKILLLFERAGQVCCTVSILIFSDFKIAPFSAWSWWLIASFFLMIFYEMSWIRYFKNEHTERNFYLSFYGIPVPGASLPVLAFLLLGIYGKVVWLIASAVIIGVGHIGIHIQHLKAAQLTH
ncbi:hypothetical protein [Neobacillus niacini]|uniref:hypothetical protein n=1 Tax=Neobacillus niacini TaxID=86668 RepID=UPI0021CB11F8|nr:hypothetical protein [Neobacillus niacini]MCM3766229.1 hypothetical protein [Neobacillus niacini]